MGAHAFVRTAVASAAIATLTVVPAFVAVAQSAPPASATTTKQSKTPKADKVAKPSPFFESEKPLELTLTANFRQLRGDKGTEHPWRPGTLSYTADDGKPVTAPVRVRTRGIWRLKTCQFPPTRLNFVKDSTKATVFKGLDQPKLVSYCRDNDEAEQYVLQELQLYRIYRLLTPISHAARLVRMTYMENAGGRPLTTRYAFLMEEFSVVAAQAGGEEIATKGAKKGDLDPYHDALIGVFQYFIGNTDFSISGLHNAELIQRPDGTIFPVAYDFDFSGAVNARYATVDPSLTVKNVRDRLFRGMCVETAEFNRVIALFNDKKSAIYALYSDEVGQRMARRTVDETLKYFDEFYRTIKDPRKVKREILDACRGGS